jgi:hypothetical protein
MPTFTSPIGTALRSDKIGEITDPEFGSGLCCGTLHELPQQVGALQAGTLL